MSGFLSISIFLITLFLPFSVVIAQPSIFFIEEIYDFGEVTQGNLLEHTFLLSNNGTETLVIEKVTAA